MSWIPWRPRSLRDAAARLVTFSATVAGGVYILARVTGWHPRPFNIAALSASGVLSILQAATRKRRDTPADPHGEPDCQAVPGPAPEVVILVEQGRKIQAIKRYRQLNPGIGLKEAKDVIDGL